MSSPIFDDTLGDMDAKEARLSILSGIRITEDEVMGVDKMVPAVVMAEDNLSCYVCLMLASYGVVVEAVTWERVQQAATVDPVIQELGRLLEEGFPETRNEVGEWFPNMEERMARR